MTHELTDGLHAAIMNLPCNELHAGSSSQEVQRAYGKGHRDARHAAAETVLAHLAQRGTSETETLRQISAEGWTAAHDDEHDGWPPGVQASALTRFKAREADTPELVTESPLERLRYFLSLALNGQDWLDVEPLLDALGVQEFDSCLGKHSKMQDAAKLPTAGVSVDRHQPFPPSDADGKTQEAPLQAKGKP